MQTTRCAVQVDAGLLPGTPESEYTKVWVIQSEAWNAPDADQGTLLSELIGKATDYSVFLMMQPDRFNWVRTEWVWY